MKTRAGVTGAKMRLASDMSSVGVSVARKRQFVKMAEKTTKLNQGASMTQMALRLSHELGRR